jgi:transposase
MMRLGHYRPVHVKSKASQLLRTALIARKKFVEHMLSVETTIRGLLKVNGLKLGNVNRCRLPQKLRLCSMMHRSCDWLLLRCSKRGT